MTIRPYIYGTATNGSHASVVNGSDIVTGSFTTFTTLNFADFFSLGGVMVPVYDIIDNTHLQLAYPWPGATASGAAYAVTAGIEPTDARRYGWAVFQYYQQLASLPTDVQGFRDEAIAARDAASISATSSSGSAGLAAAWASTAHNVDVPGAAPGSRSALHWSVEASNSATAATTNGAAQVAAAAAQVVIAAAWAQTPANTDVTTPGTRSALHYSGVAAQRLTDTTNVYNATVAVQSTINGYLGTASGYVQLAADWAQKAIGQDVNGVGTRSALHWSSVSQGYATAAQSYRDTAQTYAAAAAASASLLANPDFGLITSSVTDNADWGLIA